MSIRRITHSTVLLVLLFVALMPAASAQRSCADALRYCNSGCDEVYGESLLRGGCRTGCGIGYLYCVMTN